MAMNSYVTAQHDAPAITRTLAEFVVNHPSKGWSDEVEHEALRTFLNWLGCAIGGSRHESVVAALEAMNEFEPSPQATLLGRSERVDMASASLINGISSHAFDFDDTHLKTIIHPAGPVASALLALSEKENFSGRELLDALILGIDVSCRLGNMVYPQHYDRGWHITGTTGMLGAAAGCARLLKLNIDQTIMALGIAASQPVGLREQFGTMTKPLHPGAAARVGLNAAVLAKHGFTASTRAIEAARGFAQVISDKVDWNEITDELGSRFEISFNSYKPFACGIVIHPTIDACVQLRNKHQLQAKDIKSIQLEVHSLVLELTGKKTPKDGLEAKFSVYHSAAAGIIYGRAGEEQYADDVVNSPEMLALRDLVTATVNPEIKEQEVKITVTLLDGTVINGHVTDAIGSVGNPMTDAQVEQKFDDLVDPILGQPKAEAIKALCWTLAQQDTLKELLTHCR